MTLITLLIISIISLIITEDLDPLIFIKEKLGINKTRKIYSKYKFIDTIIYSIWKVLNCPACLSYHLTWIFYLLIGSYIGFIYGFLTYAITRLLYNYLWTTSF